MKCLYVYFVTVTVIFASVPQDLCDTCVPTQDCPLFKNLNITDQLKWMEEFPCGSRPKNNDFEVPAGFASAAKGDYVCCSHNVWGVERAQHFGPRLGQETWTNSQPHRPSDNDNYYKNNDYSNEPKNRDYLSKNPKDQPFDNNYSYYNNNPQKRTNYEEFNKYYYDKYTNRPQNNNNNINPSNHKLDYDNSNNNNYDNDQSTSNGGTTLWFPNRTQNYDNTDYWLTHDPGNNGPNNQEGNWNNEPNQNIRQSQRPQENDEPNRYVPESNTTPSSFFRPTTQYDPPENTNRPPNYYDFPEKNGWSPVRNNPPGNEARPPQHDFPGNEATLPIQSYPRANVVKPPIQFDPVDGMGKPPNQYNPHDSNVRRPGQNFHPENTARRPNLYEPPGNEGTQPIQNRPPNNIARPPTHYDPPANMGWPSDQNTPPGRDQGKQHYRPATTVRPPNHYNLPPNQYFPPENSGKPNQYFPPENSRPPNNQYFPPENSRPPNNQYFPPENSRPPNNQYFPPENSRPPNNQYFPPENSRPPNNQYFPPENSGRSNQNYPPRNIASPPTNPRDNNMLIPGQPTTNNPWEPNYNTLDHRTRRNDNYDFNNRNPYTEAPYYNSYDQNNDRGSSGGGQCHLTSFPPDPQSDCCGRQLADDDRITGRPNKPNTNQWSNTPRSGPVWRNRRSISNNDTEVTVENRISGGHATEFYQYPWTVLLLTTFDYGNQEASFNCGGGLLSAKYVLTAGHCVYEKRASVKSVQVYLAEYDKNTFPKDCKTTSSGKKCIDNIEMYAEEVITHPQYENENLVNDIALLRLRGSAPYRDYVRPICLPTINIDEPQFANIQFEVAGWGRTGQYSSSIKQSTVLNLVNHNQCKQFYPQLTSKHLCAAGKKGEDTCKGDSGGPLMALYRGRYYVVGIVSGKRADSPCGTTVPSLYTNVYHYVDWIRSIIRA